jgi:hypothetical protein
MAEGSTQGTSKLLSSAKYVREGWSERPKGIVGDAQVFYNGAIAACQADGTSTVVRLLPLPFAREGYKCTAVDLQARNQTSRYAYFYAKLAGNTPSHCAWVYKAPVCDFCESPAQSRRLDSRHTAVVSRLLRFSHSVPHPSRGAASVSGQGPQVEAALLCNKSEHFKRWRLPARMFISPSITWLAIQSGNFHHT